ncbi:MAG: sigma-54-dependent Fis family transcriptional regulator [Sedimentisphaerales bacterium]|nr:sigma-54-dependent Fis family transcriptional regulator [Sedimentisphaerales bacterium]
MNSKPTILVVDPDREHVLVLREAIEDRCAGVWSAERSEEALEFLDRQAIDLVLAEWNLAGGESGLAFLDQTHAMHPNIPVILMTGAATIDACKEAIRHGAADYLVKPLNLDELRGFIARLARQQRRQGSDFVFEGVLSRSPAMQRIFHILRRVSPTDITILIEGESGTGKELTARAIHANSPRRDKLFRPINCAGFTESLLESELFGHAKGAFTGAASDRKGLFEVADKGTLFLDEIGDMPQAMQAKLLRVLEDGVVLPVGSNKPSKVDVRVISATNHDLAKLVEEKKFRQDLYFRIKGVSVVLPPLRQRREDIEEMFGYFLKQACEDLGRDIHRITEPAMNILVSYHWPGNIRQLRHTVRTMVVLCDGDTLDVEDIPLDIHHIKRLSGQIQTPAQAAASSPTAGLSLEEVEKRHIAETLTIVEGNRAEAAKILNIGERTLYRKIKEYGL